MYDDIFSPVVGETMAVSDKKKRFCVTDDECNVVFESDFFNNVISSFAGIITNTVKSISDDKKYCIEDRTEGKLFTLSTQEIMKIYIVIKAIQ